MVEGNWGVASRGPQLAQHVFGVEQAAGGDIFLGRQQRAVQGGAVIRLEPIPWIERKKLNDGALRELSRLINQEAALVHASFQCHVKRLPRRGRGPVSVSVRNLQRPQGVAPGGIFPLPGRPHGVPDGIPWTAPTKVRGACSRLPAASRRARLRLRGRPFRRR